MAKTKLHVRKRQKTWNQICPSQREKLTAMLPPEFTPMKGAGFIAFAPESNSEVGVVMSEEGECRIQMWREIDKDVFAHSQIISVYGAKALFIALGAALYEYDANHEPTLQGRHEHA